MTTTDIVLIITTVSATLRWWFERRDARSALADAKAKAEAAVTTLEGTVTAKNAEIAAKDATIAQRDRMIDQLLESGGQKDRRIEHLERRLEAVS